MRGRFADARLIRRAVDVNVTGVGIHVAAAVEAGFETFQPQNTRGDFGVRHSPPGIANRPATLENCSDRPAAADFFHDAMQSERRALRAFRLPDAES